MHRCLNGHSFIPNRHPTRSRGEHTMNTYFLSSFTRLMPRILRHLIHSIFRGVKLFHLGGVVRIVFTLCSLFFLCLLFPRQLYAISCVFTHDPVSPTMKDSTLKFQFSSPNLGDALKDFATPGDLQIAFPQFDNTWNCGTYSVGSIDTDSEKLKYDGVVLEQTINWYWHGAGINKCRPLFDAGTHKVQLRFNNNVVPLCEGEYSVRETPVTCKINYDFSHTNNPTDGTVGDTGWKIIVTDIKNLGWFDPRIYVKIDDVWLDGQDLPALSEIINSGANAPGPYEFPLPSSVRNVQPDPHHAVAYVGNGIFFDACSPTIDFSIVGSGDKNICTDPSALLPPGQADFPGEKRCDVVDKDHDYSKCPWCPQGGSIVKLEMIKLCDQLPKDAARNREGAIDYSSKCWECVKQGNDKTQYVWTAIGCVPTDFTTIINDYIFRYGIGIAGGLAFLRFLYGCFLIMTSSGNAETVEESKAIIMSALAGLFLIIFSVFFLRTIGVDVFQIPCWGSNACDGSASSVPAPSSPSTPANQCGSGQDYCGGSRCCQKGWCSDTLGTPVCVNPCSSNATKPTYCSDSACCAGDSACQYEVTAKGWACRANVPTPTPNLCPDLAKPTTCKNVSCCGVDTVCQYEVTGRGWGCKTFCPPESPQRCGASATCCSMDKVCQGSAYGSGWICAAPSPTPIPTATPLPPPTATPTPIPLPAGNTLLGWQISAPPGPYTKGQVLTVSFQHSNGAGFFHVLLSTDAAGLIVDCKQLSVMEISNAIRLPDTAGGATLRLATSRLLCAEIQARGNISGLTASEITQQAHAQVFINP